MDKLYAEKCRELAELKKQIPPCKVGDTVYVKMQSGEYAEAEESLRKMNETEE